jgi:hypothetical protein
MPHPKFQLNKHVKISGKWRYCQAASYSNGKVKPHVVVVGAQEEKHEEGSYCVRHKKSWIEAGADPLEAQRMRFYLTVGPAANAARIPAPLKMRFQIAVPDIAKSQSSGRSSAELEFHAGYCGVSMISVVPLAKPPGICVLSLTNAGRLRFTGIPAPGTN